MGKENQDPASVVFAGCEMYLKDTYDALIIDTAGRLQTKVNLMKELEKIKKIVNKQLPNHTICTLLTIDAMLGQNSLEQAQIFHEAAQLDGIVLTKIDGTGKGGIVFAIMQAIGVPVAYLSYGEKIDQLKPFNAVEYVQNLLRSE
jgi:fused signal recognition particle receptor